MREMTAWSPQRISVVVPTYNRPALLARVLEGFERQTWPRHRFEVIVVDDGGDQPAEPVVAAAAARGLPVACERQENSGPAAARNRGTRQASGDVVLYVDDDCVPDERLLEEHARGHTVPGLVTIGRVEWHADVPMTPLLRFATERFLFSFQQITVEDDAPFNMFYTANAAVHRQTALDAGLFDESFPRAAWEDTEMAYRLRQAGVRFVYRRHAVVAHLRGFELLGFLRRERAAGYEAVRVWRKHPELSHLISLDQVVGEEAEFSFFESAGRYAWLVGASEALRVGGPGVGVLEAVGAELAQEPDLGDWRDAYVREHEARNRLRLAQRQRVIEDLRRENDRLAARLKERSEWAETLEVRFAELETVYEQQTAWAGDLEERLSRVGERGGLRRLMALVRRLAAGVRS